MSTAPQTDFYGKGLKLSQAGRHLDAIVQFEQALAAKPDDARVLFALGNTARTLGMPKPAEEFFRRVLVQEPARIEALVNLANLLRAQGSFTAAIALLEPALARAPDNAELLLTLGSTYREMNEPAKAREKYEQALVARPDYAPALGNLADLLADDGDIEEALALYDRALKSDPGNAQARLNRAILHLFRGDLKNGWKDYTARVKVPNKVPISEHRLKAWTGGALKKTRLLVTAEQGVGDQIMFASVIPELAARAARDGGSVILECEPRLVDLFARSFSGVTVRGCEIETRCGVTIARQAWLKSVGGATAAVELGSLPRYFRGTIDAFANSHAYLKPDLGQTILWQGALSALGNGPYVGICWRSGAMGGHRNIQYAPREAWADFLSDVPGTLVCVQYDAHPEEIAELERLSGRRIFVPDGIDQKNELDRTASLLAALDAVVSAPTAVSWLAAATGVPTFKILYDTSWTAFGESHEPFAPACLCMMPDTRGDWASTFAKTKAALTTQL